MKLLKIIATLIWMTSSISYAEPELSSVFKGGLNAATQDHDFRVTREGFSGGLGSNLQWPLLRRLSLGGQLELLYTQRGSETVVQGAHVGKVREHYVDLTAAARPEVRLGPVSIYLLLGGGLNLLVSAHKDDAAGAGQDITGDSHLLDVSLLGAAGVTVHIPHNEQSGLHLDTIFLEARHDIGLLDVDAVNGGFKNRTSSLMLGVSFVVGGASAPAPAPNQASS